ncbi:kinetochore-associated Ndc80 complex subunit spc25 [Geranomyces variabilis]|uniref:Kinetochore protein SPC25 n=1 Tax=Geranomyces variabilis TaxID=109894 RepID=A0AAD5TDR2_9FUNG|nr:kinetochore-associated Ndc80 complex subunit spc25 [Geranomyces variabilis]
MATALSKSLARMSLAPLPTNTSGPASAVPQTPGPRGPASSSSNSVSVSAALDSSGNVQLANISARTAAFLASFDPWVADQRRRMAERKAEHGRQVNELRDKKRQLEKMIEDCQHKHTDLQRASQKDISEAAALQSEINVLQSDKHERDLAKEDLLDRVRDRRDELRRRREELHRRHADRLSRAGRRRPELECYQEKLAMTVNQNGDEALEFVFTHLNAADWTQQARFTIDVRRSAYRVTECEPPLANLNELVDYLNKTRGTRGSGGFYTFLKHMRAGFAKLAKGEP